MAALDGSTMGFLMISLEELGGVFIMIFLTVLVLFEDEFFCWRDTKCLGLDGIGLALETPALAEVMGVLTDILLTEKLLVLLLLLRLFMVATEDILDWTLVLRLSATIWTNASCCLLTVSRKSSILSANLVEDVVNLSAEAEEFKLFMSLAAPDWFNSCNEMAFLIRDSLDKVAIVGTLDEVAILADDGMKLT
jgi:hypothetical protein